MSTESDEATPAILVIRFDHDWEGTAASELMRAVKAVSVDCSAWMCINDVAGHLDAVLAGLGWPRSAASVWVEDGDPK